MMANNDLGRGDGPHRMRDSGLGSIGSESDTSPNQPANTLTAVNPVNIPLSPPAQTILAAVDVMTGSYRSVSDKKYPVTYIGHTILERRYTQPQFWKSFVPWLVAEVKRKPQPHDVLLQVHSTGSYTLKGFHQVTEKVLFEHKLQQLSKFSRIHRDTKCFVYLTKGSGDVYICHVYQAPEEGMVVELFESIRDATKQAISDPTQTTVNVECSNEYARATPASLFEIMYIGKMPVVTKKAAPTFIDETVEKFIQYEQKKQKQAEEQERKRHASGNSVRSLPTNLDQSVTIKENDLADQSAEQQESNESTISNGSSGSGSGDALSGSSSENILNNNTQPGIKTEVGDLYEGLGKADTDNLQRMALYNQGKKNRTMLLQITANEVCLINTDRKKVIMKRNFRDISFCSQGIQHPHHFGFITKDMESSAFLCYVFMCATEQVVKEVMQTLKQAFLAAYQQSTKNHTCDLCPMHQLHKLCEDIDKLEAELAYELIMKRIMQLDEQDQVEIMTNFQSETVETHQEMNEVLISILRHMCELKQSTHTHITGGANRNTTAGKNEFNLSENSKSQKIAHKLGDIRLKARKSLTHSFESLKKSKSKFEEAREAFRKKSWATDSSDFSFDSNYSAESTDSTPVSSPLSKEAPAQLAPTEDTTDGPSSPGYSDFVARKRSSSESQAEERRAELEANNGTGSVSGIRHPDLTRRHMFNRANNNNSLVSRPYRTPSPVSGVTENPAVMRARTTPRRRSSWRLSILNKVVTPARIPPSSMSSLEDEEDPLPPHLQNSKPSLGPVAVRQLWKKAILETLLLIRMEKEKKSLKAHQDEEETRRLKLDYEEITPCLKEVTKVWDGMLTSPARAITKFSWEKLNMALKDGVPRSRRGDIWQLIVEQHKLHKPNYMHVDQTKHPYNDLLKMLTTHQHAILIDLGRTFPGHPYFSTQLGSGQLSLFNLLKAYSLLDKEVGYCQGISFVAGVLLMHMPEEKAFETMEFLMFNLGFRRQYRPDMVALQIQLYQLSRLLHDYYRDLYDHFELHDIAPTMYAAAWFLTIFASQFPLGFVARVFDLLFIQGVEVVFKVALVLLGNHKELIKQCNSFESIMEFLKSTLPGMGIIQMERIINQVFSLDISKQLHAYEVEYHVLQEEMITTPQRSEIDVVSKLETANHNLKRQNLELLEKLQASHSASCSLEDQVTGLQSTTDKLKSRVRTLELERAALLKTVEKLRAHVPNKDDDINPESSSAPASEKTANGTAIILAASPIHNPMVNRFLDANSGDVTLKSNSLTDLNREVEEWSRRRKSSEDDRRQSGEGDGFLHVGKDQTHRPRSANN